MSNILMTNRCLSKQKISVCRDTYLEFSTLYLPWVNDVTIYRTNCRKVLNTNTNDKTDSKRCTNLKIFQTSESKTTKNINHILGDLN